MNRFLLCHAMLAHYRPMLWPYIHPSQAGVLSKGRVKFRGRHSNVYIGNSETKPSPNPNTDLNPNPAYPTHPTKRYHLTVLFKVYKDCPNDCYNAFQWCLQPQTTL